MARRLAARTSDAPREVRSCLRPATCPGAGPTSNSWKRSARPRSSPARPPAPANASAPPASRRPGRSRTSTSPPSPAPRNRSSRTTRSWPGSTRPPTSAFSDRPAPARAISPRHWRSRPARRDTAPGSRPPSSGGVDRLEGAQHRNSLDEELRKLDRYRLLIIDEIGYLPLERQAADLLFALIARRHERGSIIVTSNRGFEAWGEILGDAMVAAALIDRLVHHATMVALKGKSYRLRERAANSATPRQRARPQALS